MGIVIRVATLDGVVLLAGLVRTAFRDVAERFGLTPDNCPTHPSNCTPGWIETALDDGVTYYVLDMDGRPRG